MRPATCSIPLAGENTGHDSSVVLPIERVVHNSVVFQYFIVSHAGKILMEELPGNIPYKIRCFQSVRIIEKHGQVANTLPAKNCSEEINVISSYDGFCANVFSACG
jgi:hypothetical protein